MLLSDTNPAKRRLPLSPRILLISALVVLLLVAGAAFLSIRGSGLGIPGVSRPVVSQSVPAPTSALGSNQSATFSRTDLEIHESDYCQCQK